MLKVPSTLDPVSQRQFLLSHRYLLRPLGQVGHLAELLLPSLSLPQGSLPRLAFARDGLGRSAN